MKLLGSLIILLSPLYQFTQLDLFLGQILPFRLYFYDLILFVFILPHLFKWVKKRPKHPVFKPFIVFSVAALLSLLIAPLLFPLTLVQFFTASLYLLRFFFIFSLLFVKFSVDQRKLFYFSLFLIPISGLLQYLFLPDLRFFKGIGFDDHFYRLTFPFLDPNYVGAALSFIFLTTLSIWSKKPAKTLLFLTLIALVLTFSRASYLSLFSGLIFLFITSAKIRKILLPLSIIFVALVMFAPKPFGEGVNLLRTFSISSRLHNYQQGFELSLKNPLTGLGFNTLSTHQNTPTDTISRSSAGLDNSFLFILSTTGIFGLSAYFYLLYSLFHLKANFFFKAGLVSLIVHSFFNNTLFYVPILILLLLSFNFTERNESSDWLC